MTALVVVSLVLRTRLLKSWFWVDEGLSVGIASHRIARIPFLLRRDGSPPLYYLVLHVWMSLFGRGEAATHVLSLIFALAIIPVAFWAGESLFDRRAGWFAAILAASNPFLTYYAQETRMYTLAALLSLVAVTCFLHAFVLEDRRFIVPFAVALALVMYTHNWGLFLAVGLVAAAGVCVLSAVDHRGALRNAVVGFAGAGVLYLPWIPTVLSQAAHTGAPWSPAPTVTSALTDFVHLVGDKRGASILAVSAAAGLFAVVRSRRPLDQRILLVAAVALTTCFAAAFLASVISPAWTLRYLAVVIAPMIVLVGFGVARSGKFGVAALVVLVALSPQAVSRVGGAVGAGRGFKGNDKTVVRDARLHMGDLVVAVRPEEVPVLDYYAPRSVRFATTMGPAPDPRLVDWRDALDRLRAASPARDLLPLADALPAGARLALMIPSDEILRPDLPWFSVMRQQARSYRRALMDDPRFRLQAVLPRTTDQDTPGLSVHALIFQRLRGASPGVG